MTRRDADAGIAAFGAAATDAGYTDSGVANDDADPLDLSTDTETTPSTVPASRPGRKRVFRTSRRWSRPTAA